MGLREGVVVGAQLSNTLLQNWTVGSAGTMRTGPYAGERGLSVRSAPLQSVSRRHGGD
jgi:hypothetical protein